MQTVSLNILSEGINPAYIKLVPLILISEGIWKTEDYWYAQVGFRIKNPNQKQDLHFSFC